MNAERFELWIVSKDPTPAARDDVKKLMQFFVDLIGPENIHKRSQGVWPGWKKRSGGYPQYFRILTFTADPAVPLSRTFVMKRKVDGITGKDWEAESLTKGMLSAYGRSRRKGRTDLEASAKEVFGWWVTRHLKVRFVKKTPKLLR